MFTLSFQMVKTNAIGLFESGRNDFTFDMINSILRAPSIKGPAKLYQELESNKTKVYLPKAPRA